MCSATARERTQGGALATEVYYCDYASIAPGMLGGMIDPNYQGWVNASWDWTDANRKTSYYDSEIQIICKLVASGNWWKP